MLGIPEILCDSCGEKKQQTNHWFIIRTNKKSITLATFRSIKPIKDDKHFCGESCLVKEISLFFKEDINAQ